MKKSIYNILLFLPALLTVIIWGSTFLVSKNILDAGIHPVTLMTLRFGLAYLILVFATNQSIPFTLNYQSFKRESLFLLLGISGGSLYFIVEYFSLKLTSAVNVGLISATVPILSTGISLIFGLVKVNYKYYIGSLIAFIGVAVVIFNGSWSLKISFFGDCLAIISSLLWAIYTVVLNLLGNRYSEAMITRRLFFYAFITIIGYSLYKVEYSELIVLTETSIYISVLYLAVVASCICMYLWNVSINNIGLIKTNNFLYLLPVFTLLTSLLFAQNEVTIYSIIGTISIISGIYISDKQTNNII